jgi:uncharacterized protein (TIGR02271 family)
MERPTGSQRQGPALSASSQALQRNARIEAADGSVGRLKHIILQPGTHALTHLVVLHNGKEWLIPADEAFLTEGGRLRLSGPWSRYKERGAFEHRDYHAVDESLRSARPVVSTSVPDRPAESTVSSAVTGPLQQLELLEECLQPAVESEVAGVVRVSRRVVERIETVEVPVHEERAVFERVPGSGNGRIVVGGQELQEGEPIEITLATERITVQKERVPLGDVSVRKEPSEHEEHFQETVRSEELVVDAPPGLVAETLSRSTEVG